MKTAAMKTMKAFTARLARKTKRMSNIARCKYSHKTIVYEGVSEKTIMSVLSLRTMFGCCMMLFTAIDVHDYMEKSKFYNAYGCRRMCERTRPTTALVDPAQAGPCECLSGPAARADLAQTGSSPGCVELGGSR
eukprot:15286453-Heterocapsa_arctica.AAC.1